MAADEYYSRSKKNPSASSHLYWLIDESLLYLILDFILELDRLGYDRFGWYIRESYRHPQNNFDTGGSGKSLHLQGKAADIVVQDIDRDGYVTKKDKEICLTILEKLVGDKGGLGRYPGALTIHVDTRGHKARWNSYVPANKNRV